MEAEAKPKLQILRYALSVEELAMAFTLIGQQQYGLNCLAASYANLDAEKAALDLRVAGHSLLARELCHLTPEKLLEIDKQFGSILNLLCGQDYRVQVKYTSSDDNGLAHIHVHIGKVFATHYTRQGGLVHYVEYGVMPEFPLYLISMFPSFGLTEKGITPMAVTASLDKEIFARALEASSLEEAYQPSLASSGWEEGTWRQFQSDFNEAEYKVGLLRLENEQDAPSDEIYLVRGKNNWLVEFANGAGAVHGSVKTVDQKDFLSSLQKYN
jgi:hypothetical protein